MILIFLINVVFACEFDFTLNQDNKDLQYKIQEKEFTAFGIWTRYYAFYQNISIDKDVTYYDFVPYYEYIIFTGLDNKGEAIIEYNFIKEKYSRDPNHILTLDFIVADHYIWEQYTFNNFIDESYEGVWIFTYIGFDRRQNRIDIILVNTKINKFLQYWYGETPKYQIALISLQGDFPGQVSFTSTYSSSVKFTKGEDLLIYLKSCNPGIPCYSNQINSLISGILNAFEQPFQFTMQNNYWIDGWFQFTPLISMKIYNNLILQIVQYDKEVLKYNGIIPLKIMLNYDLINLDNNGITVETTSYSRPVWDDSKLNPIKVQLFNKSYLELMQRWVYFRFLQYEQLDNKAEFYLSFSDSHYVIKNMGQINLFKYGKFFIYLGQSQLNPNGFVGQIANINIQSCLSNYPIGKRNCHISCLTCNGPTDQNCLSCIDESQTNRILNPLANSCNCKEGFISQEGQIQCVEIQVIMKSSTYQQLPIEQTAFQPCKDGQFQYQYGSQIKCYDCPQQSSSGIICADCLENLFTWYKNMKCSYDYYQENNNQNNTFIKSFRPQQKIDYYYIHDEVLICYGCQLYEGGNQIVQDRTILYGSCHQGYYYKNSYCQPCQLQNCLKCDDITGQCSQCQNGFVLYNQNCYSCPDYCQSCLFGDKIICTSCAAGFTIGNGQCIECSANCLICQFDTNLNRPKCLVCKYDGYHLIFDGVDCVQNTIQNCLIQYQLFYVHYSTSTNPECDNIYYTTTLGFIYGCKKSNEDDDYIELFDICGLCQPYYINYYTNCTYNGTLNSNEQVLVKYYCDFDICFGDEDSVIELVYIISSENSQIVITNCQIDQCSQCQQVQNIIKCLQCSEGYYANVLNGQCVSCPSSLNCYTCQQQNENDKDGWKWKIRPFSIYQYGSDLVSSTNSKDYEIICLTCLDGYMLLDNKCILNCPKNCQKCSIIDGQNVCTFCGSNTYDRLLTIQNNQCSNCPNNCEFCQPRSLADVQKINGLFNPDDGSKNFYSYICLKPRIDFKNFFNQFLQQYVKCQIGNFCMSQLNLKLKAHCDQQSYSNEQSKYANIKDFYYENVLISDIFANTTQHFQNIETPQFLEYLNVNQIISLIYELTLISSSDHCQITNFISTKVPRNVFSVLKNKLIINTNNLNLKSQGAQILNFSEVEILNSKFNYPFSINISHPNQIIVKFKDIIHVSAQDNSISIIIINPSSIEIQNFYIQAISNLQTSQSNIISYQYTNTSTVSNLSIKMDNLQLIKSEFYDINFITLSADTRILNLKLSVSNSYIESTFQNSSFIKESQITNYGSINLNNVTFIVQVHQTHLIYLNGQLNLQCSFKLTGNFANSNFIRTNQFYIIDSLIYNTSLYNTTLFDNMITNQYNQKYIHRINNLKFQSVQFDIYSNFITIIDKNLQGQLFMENIQMIDCSFLSKQLTKTTQRLIIIEGLIFQLLNSHFQKSVLGLTDISIRQSQSVIINNVTVVGNNIQGLQKKLDCYQDQVKISLQNGFIQMENIESIQILNSQFNNIMVQNYPIIRISLFDDSIELYKLQVTNTSFKNNLILKTEILSQNSIFQVLSTKGGNFNALNVSFIENILNEYQQTQFSNSATTFLLEAEQFNITLNNIRLSKNQNFNSSDSNLYIKASRITIQNSTFIKSNQYDDFILSFIIWGVASSNNFYQENLQELFPIKSVGANAKLVVDKLFIQFCLFSDSMAYQGSGFHLTLQNSLQIFDTTFTNLRNKLDKEDSMGGSIFISLIAQNATIEIINSNFENTSSLYDGGALYINSEYTTSNITLSQISVQNCYSFYGTFISASLNKYSSLRITSLSIKNNIEEFNNYLSQFNDLDDDQVERFQQRPAIFYILLGSFYISNSIISDIQLSGVLYFYSATYLYINELVIQNIQFNTLGLIQIIPTSITNTVTFIQDVKIINCTNVQPVQQQQIICQNNIISLNNLFQCDNYNNKPKSLSSYPYDKKAKVNCLYQKLLDFTSSSNMINIDKIQTSDYLYISDLEMRNNNCSLCKGGMITIKNIDINTPESNNIILKKIQLKKNQCGLGCLVISQQQTIYFPTRRILQNTLYSSRFTIPFTVLIEQSEFVDNSAQNGIIIVSNLSLSVIDNKFMKNTGSDISGGILYLGDQNQTFQIMTSEISDSIGNKGGALYLGNKTISSTELLQVLLSSNQATSFGQDFVGIPQALTISIDGGKTLFQVKQIQKTPTIIQEIVIKPYIILGNKTLQQFVTLPSGYSINKYQYYNETLKTFIPYNLTLRLIALNSLKQQIFNLQNTYCTIKKRKINININDSAPFDDQGISMKKIEFNNTSQDYNLDDLQINFDPYQSHDYVLQIQFNCSSVQIPIINDSAPYNVIDYSKNYELRMNVRTFECQRGEYYNSSLGTCNLCNSSLLQYSVVIKASRCNVSDEITMKSVNSTHIELRENYWRPSDDNDFVTYCYNFPVNCKGGWSPGYDSCTLGHIGALCEQCDLYNIRGSGSYATTGQFQCGSCSNLSLNTLQIFLIVIWTLISIFLSVKGTVENVDELVRRMKAIKVGFICVYFERVQIAVLMKIFTNYLQIISTISTFQLKLPSELRSLFTYSGNPIKSAMYSLDCFLVELSNIQIIYFRNIWFLLMPIIYSSITFIIYFILVKLKYMDYKITVLSTTLIFIFIYVQPDIIGSFISLLSFRKISQILWVQGNVSYKYQTTSHERWLVSFVVPVLIVFGLLIPLILYIKMSKQKHKLNDTLVLRLYGYLYNEYSKVAYYWEIIKICQKELIIIFLTYYEDVIIIKGTIVFIIIFCYDLFSKRYMPYKRVDLNQLDSQSSFVCGFSIVLGMAIFFGEQYGNEEILWPFFIFLGIFNIYFIIRLVKLLIIGYFDKLADQLDQIREYINTKYPNIVQKYPWLKKYLENSKIKSTRIKQRFLKLKLFLMEKVHQNKQQKIDQKLETDNEQDIKQKELDSNNKHSRNDAKNSKNQSILQSDENLKDDIIIQQSRNDANQSILSQKSSKNSKNQIILQCNENLQDQIIISLDSEKIIKKQFEEPDEDIKQDQQDQMIQKMDDSCEPLPSEVQNIQEFNFQPEEEDLQNNRDEEEEEQEQLNYSFQQ